MIFVRNQKLILCVTLLLLQVATSVVAQQPNASQRSSRTSTPIPNPSVNNFRGQIRRLPPFVLLEALDRAPTLCWVGEDEIGGKRQKVISVLRPDKLSHGW